jgi:hypothetical protein
MKAILFVPTGETRQALGGEWYRANSSETYTCCRLSETLYDHPIYTRHEIEIPEDAFSVECISWPKSGPRLSAVNIPIPRPKKKVKKWRWLYEDEDGVGLTFDYLASEHDVRQGRSKKRWCRPIPETEIEVTE